MTLRLLVLACLTNAVMGLLYVWSLFLLPLETTLGAPRSALSLIPALALVTFTLGMMVHDRLLAVLGFRAFSLLAFGLAGGGHLLFAFDGGYAALLTGYGLLFGLGAGLGYGLALALVTRLPTRVRNLGLGLAMAAFAISGVVLSSLFAQPIRETDPTAGFLIIGLAILAAGSGVTAFLPTKPARPIAVQECLRPTGQLRVDMADPKFLRLALIFFFNCYTGLMVVSHSTGMVQAQGGDERLVDLSPGVFTFGYILGSLVGGRLVELFSGRSVLVLSNLLAAAGLVAFLSSASVLVLAGVLAAGMVFGAPASLMPVLIGETYGTGWIGEIYGKLMVSYGAAGLIAPSLTGQLFSMTGSYAAPVGIGIAMCVSGVLLGLTLSRR